MKYEIQVHFENQGQLAWKRDITGDVGALLESILESQEYTAHDEENDRYMSFRTESVIAIMAIPNQMEDPIRKLYAPKERLQQENDQQERIRNAPQWLPGEGGRCC